MILQIQLEEASALLGFSKENLDWIFSETFELCRGESITQYDVCKRRYRGLARCRSWLLRS